MDPKQRLKIFFVQKIFFSVKNKQVCANVNTGCMHISVTRKLPYLHFTFCISVNVYIECALGIWHVHICIYSGMRILGTPWATIIK